jgi:hypothetical protein
MTALVDAGRDIRSPICTATLLAALFFLASGCSDGCNNSLVTRSDSPDGRHSAVMFQRDCGATTGFSTQVSVLATGDDLSGFGNAFRADDDQGMAVAGAWGGPWAELKWLSPDHLLVKYAVGSRIFARASQVSGVRISYQAAAR